MNISHKYKLMYFHLAKCAGKSIIKALDIKTDDKTNLESRLRQTQVLGLDMRYWNSHMYTKEWETYPKFTVVRNPWDRMVSLYHFRKKENDLYKLLPSEFGMDIMGGNKVGPDGKKWNFKRWILSSNVKGIYSSKQLQYLKDNKTPTIKKQLSLDSNSLEKAIEDHIFFTAKDSYINLIINTTKYTEMSPDGPVEAEGYQLQVRDRIEWWNQIDIISEEHGEKLVDYILRFEHLEEMWNKMFERLEHEPPKLPKKNVSKHKHYSTYYDDETRKFVGHLFKKDIEAFGYEFEQEKE